MQNAKCWFDLKKPNIIKHKKFIIIYKTGYINLTIENIEIGKNIIYHHKIPIFLRDVHINKVLVSNKTSFGKKDL